MTPRSSRARAILGAGLCTLLASSVLCGIPIYTLNRIGESLQYRCEQHAPEETFRRFVSPDLTGISDIRAMGESWLAGANVFLRFRITDYGLHRLLAGYQSAGSGGVSVGGVEQFATDAEYWSRANPPRSLQYEVSAAEVRKLRNPVVYQKRGSTGQTWSILVLDRPHKRAYFYHWSQ